MWSQIYPWHVCCSKDSSSQLCLVCALVIALVTIMLFVYVVRKLWSFVFFMFLDSLMLLFCNVDAIMTLYVTIDICHHVNV